MSRLVVLLCRAELIAPRCSGRNRKSDGQQHEDGLQTQVGQLEDEEQRVANFQHEPADDQIRRRYLHYSPPLELGKDLIHGCCSDALLSRANTGTLRKMTAVPLSGNKAESPRLVELDCLHGQENVQAAGVRVCDLASFRNTDRGPCVSHAGAVDRLLRSGGRGLKNFDLQYFTHTIDGKLYGGWFRILAPSQLEVLGIGLMQTVQFCGSQPELTARSVLEAFVRGLARNGRPIPAVSDQASLQSDPSLAVPSDG